MWWLLGTRLGEATSPPSLRLCHTCERSQSRKRQGSPRPMLPRLPVTLLTSREKQGGCMLWILACWMSRYPISTRKPIPGRHRLVIIALVPEPRAQHLTVTQTTRNHPRTHRVFLHPLKTTHQMQGYETFWPWNFWNLKPCPLSLECLGGNI